MEDELGDLLFAISNLGRFLHLNPEEALRKTITRFQKRFGFVESELLRQGVQMQNATLEEMDLLWEKAKSAERESKL
jgi:tetrapyrrole methylase family protein/MazG family protein